MKRIGFLKLDDKLFQIILQGAYLPALTVAEKYGIGFAPLKTTLAGQEYRDGVDIVPDEFYEKLVANKELAYINTKGKKV